MLDIAIHKLFTKELKNAKLNPTNSAKLFMYVSLLLNNETLPNQALDHELKGEYIDTRELHISGDLLIIYRIQNNTLEMLRIGSHSQLFK